MKDRSETPQPRVSWVSRLLDFLESLPERTHGLIGTQIADAICTLRVHDHDASAFDAMLRSRLDSLLEKVNELEEQATEATERTDEQRIVKLAAMLKDRYITALLSDESNHWGYTVGLLEAAGVDFSKVSWWELTDE